MKILGKPVVFADCRHSYAVGSGYAFEYETRYKQRWDIPTLGLHGFINPEHSLDRIERTILEEVKYDLAQRKKRAEGIRC